MALLTIKSLSLAEIATLRATREGRVRAQSAAIHRKAGVDRRAQLLSLFVEDLMADVPFPAAQGAEASGSRPA